MILWKQYLIDHNVDICCITETHLKSLKKPKRTKGSKKKYQESDFQKFFKDQYTIITKNRKNQKGRRGHGGVGILVKKKVGIVKEVEGKRNEGLLWIEVNCGKRKIFIATVYMVPAGSPYYTGNNKIRLDLERDITEFKEQGIVIITGDFNSRIGNLMSVTSEDKMYQRNNIDVEDNQNGRELIKLMNGLGMIILS